MIKLLPLAVSIVLCTNAFAADLNDLEEVKGWNKVANGVWSLQIGDLSNELRYTDLAAAPPRVEQLNALPDVPITKNLNNVRFRISKDHKVVVRIPTANDEKIYGYGLQFDGIQKTGKILNLKVDHFHRGGGATHAPVPFFVSSKGYGVFFNTSKFIKVYNQVGNRKDSLHNPPEVDRNPPDDEVQPGPWLAQPRSDAVEAWIHGSGLELIAFTGTNLQDIVARYNLYSGGGAMPPLWGLGFWHRVPSKFTAAQTEQEIAAFRKHNIALDVVGLEPGWQTKSYPCTFEWQTKRFPDPAAFTKRLLNDGLRLNLWENPYISRHARIYKSMLPLSSSHTVWLGIVPDYTLPQAREILVAQHKREHFDIGISGYKIDEVDGYDEWLWPDHATFPSGTSAETMRQTYGLQMQHLLYHNLFRKHNKRTYSLVRASNGAASGFPFVLYSDSYQHRQYITGLSSASLAGVLWCPEIRSARTSREWINRMHTVCLSPMSMLNAWASGTKPWSFPEATGAIRRTIQLRMKLLPYLYTAFSEYHQRGIPPVRAMILEGQTNISDVKTNRRLDGENDPYADGFHQRITEDNSLYMFGPDILVAPFHNNEESREVSLPPGPWYDFYTGQLAGSDEQIEIAAAETNNLPPLFVRDGALVPMLVESVNRTRDIRGADIEIRHYGTKSGSYTLYEDDGSTYDFETGHYNLRHFSVTGRAKGEFTMTESQRREKTEKLFGKATYRRMTAGNP